MELLKAIEKLNKLNSDIDKLDEWLSHLQINDKPATGRTWIKLKRAIDTVIEDLATERDELEDKITKATEGIEIDC